VKAHVVISRLFNLWF